MELGPADASSPRAKALQAEITERAHAVSARIQESFRDMVGQNLVVAVAGSVVHHASVRTRAAIVAELGAKLPAARVRAGGDGVGVGGGAGGGEPPPTSDGSHVGEGEHAGGAHAQRTDGPAVDKPTTEAPHVDKPIREADSSARLDGDAHASAPAGKGEPKVFDIEKIQQANGGGKNEFETPAANAPGHERQNPESEAKRQPATIEVPPPPQAQRQRKCLYNCVNADEAK